MLQTSLAFDRVVIGAAIVMTAVLFTAQAADPVNVVKLTALVLCAITVLASGAVRLVRTRVAQVPWGTPAAVGVVLLAAFVAAAAAAPVTTTAVLGTYGRNSGLLAYAAALTLFLVGLRVFTRDATRVVLYALVLAGSFTASYGLLQFAGVDTVAWNNPFNAIIAALGNPNFAAAYMAICAPAAVWGALRTDWPVGWRAVFGAVAAMCLLGAALSEAAQGPLAAAPGLAVLATAWLLDQRARVRRAGLAVLGVGAASGLSLLAAGIAGIGPAASIFTDAGSRARGWYWEAALSIFQAQPVLGVGLDSFGSFWRRERSVEAVRGLGPDNFTDAAHSVPLHLLATGGVVVALAYAAFVALTAAALVGGLRRLRGSERLLLGALGGCWAAYQVQSLVSIDQVPLIVTQYVLASAIFVASGWVRLREVRLPGAPPPPAPLPASRSGRKRRAALAAPPPRVATASDHVGVGVVAVVALALSWQALAPMRANTAVLEADLQLRGDRSAALAAYDRATDLLPGEPRYWQKKAALHQQESQPELALAALLRAVEADRYDVGALRSAAALSDAQGETEQARRLHQQALQVDPRGTLTVLPAADFAVRDGRAAEAVDLLEGLVAVLPERADAWAALGSARAAADDPAGARLAYERALQLDGEEETALAGLAGLGAQTGP